MDKEKILELRKKYMSNTFVKFEIVKALRGHELSFISAKGEEKKVAVRYLFARSIDYLQKHTNWIQFDKKLLNAYMSVATLKDIPIFSYNLEKRLEDSKYKDFNKNYNNYIVGQDFFLDFDIKQNFEKGLEEVKEMKKILDSFKVPYWVMNSSLQGIHFHIPQEFMPTFNENTMKMIAEVMYNLRGIHEFTTLDISITDNKRLCKSPYFAISDGSVALPLTDAQIENFRPEMVEISEVLRVIQIKNRGLLLRDWGLSSSELKENVKKFLSEYEGN
jgi:hypothetical protein